MKASVRNFWKANTDANTGSCSEVPDELIDKWMVHLSRCEDAEKTINSSRAFNHKSSKMNDLHWYGKEMLLKTFGDIRGQYWLDTGLLPKRPDRISKKWGEHITEHGVPDDWERLTDEDFRQLRSQVQFELSKEDGMQEMEAMMEFGQYLQTTNTSAAASSGDQLVAAAAIVKLEGPTAGQIIADKVEALKATKDQSLGRMRTINIEVRRMWAQAQKHQQDTGKDSQVIFIGECGVLEKKSVRAIRVLERWAVDGEIAIEAQVVKLVQLIEECDKLFGEALGWGKKFKFTDMGSTTSTAGKRRKKNTS